MPYIRKNEREYFNSIIDQLPPMGVGQLNYCISRILHNWLKAVGLKYDKVNHVIGVLECAKLELYRMVAAPYENKKRLANGSVSELDAISLEDVR